MPQSIFSKSNHCTLENKKNTVCFNLLLSHNPSCNIYSFDLEQIHHIGVERFQKGKERIQQDHIGVERFAK